MIAGFEGFVGHPYRDAVGVWTIGFGHTQGVGPHTTPISRGAALRLLRRDLDEHYFPPVRALPTFRKLNQNQVDALTSFVYNLGPAAIGANTGIGKSLRAGRFTAAAKHMLEWNKAGGHELRGLTRRRQAERHLFLSRKGTP